MPPQKSHSTLKSMFPEPWPRWLAVPMTRSPPYCAAKYKKLRAIYELENSTSLSPVAL